MAPTSISAACISLAPFASPTGTKRRSATLGPRHPFPTDRTTSAVAAEAKKIVETLLRMRVEEEEKNLPSFESIPHVDDCANDSFNDSSAPAPTPTPVLLPGSAAHWSRSYHQIYTAADGSPVLQDMMYASLYQVLFPDSPASVSPFLASTQPTLPVATSTSDRALPYVRSPTFHSVTAHGAAKDKENVSPMPTHASAPASRRKSTGTDGYGAVPTKTRNARRVGRLSEVVNVVGM